MQLTHWGGCGLISLRSCKVGLTSYVRIGKGMESWPEIVARCANHYTTETHVSLTVFLAGSDRELVGPTSHIEGWVWCAASSSVYYSCCEWTVPSNRTKGVITLSTSHWGYFLCTWLGNKSYPTLFLMFLCSNNDLQQSIMSSAMPLNTWTQNSL